ncbi:MAG: Flp pilus assembly complex ATPase component TadA [Myxococcaceae bacterium]|nr:Flp pilus assembly complex ATPase component TadA [Myxococcaceae bacterium]
MSMYSESLRAFLKPVLPYLDDPAVTEIMINGPEDVWIETKGKLTKVNARFTEEGLMGAARNMAQFVGRILNDERPRLDARLPDGSRIHVVIPPIARKGTTISIRKFFKDKLTIDALLKFGSLTPAMARLIEAGIHIKLNMVVSGGTGSGKTTLLNIVSSLIPDDERILTIEDSAELQLNQTHLVPFESRPPDKFGKGEVNMGDLLHSALRLRPDRIVVGEVRGGEAFHLMQAMNTGHGGSLATTHANTPTDTLRRLESLCLMSGIDLPMVAVRAQVASAINMIICCERLHDGSRKTTSLAEVLPLNEKGDYRTQEIFVFTPVTKDDDGHILGYHAPTGIIPNFVPRAVAYGFEDLTPEFFDPATYGVPPPPRFAVGEEFVTRWAPSLKHREHGEPDPEEFKEQWAEFAKKLKAEAKAKKEQQEPPPENRNPVSVQVPASPPRPASNGSSAQTRPAAPRPAPSEAAHDAEKTPPPTRNPLADRPAERRPPQQVVDEPKVEVSDELLQGDGATMSAPARSMRSGSAPARPGAGPNVTAARRAPMRPGVPTAHEDTGEGPRPDDEEVVNDGEKTAIRPVPTPRRPIR